MNNQNTINYFTVENTSKNNMNNNNTNIKLYEDLMTKSKEELVEVIIALTIRQEVFKKQMESINGELSKVNGELMLVKIERDQKEVELQRIYKENMDDIIIYVNKIKGTNKIYIGKSIQADGHEK